MTGIILASATMAARELASALAETARAADVGDGSNADKLLVRSAAAWGQLRAAMGVLLANPQTAAPVAPRLVQSAAALTVFRETVSDLGLAISALESDLANTDRRGDRVIFVGVLLERVATVADRAFGYLRDLAEHEEAIGPMRGGTGAPHGAPRRRVPSRKGDGK